MSRIPHHIHQAGAYFLTTHTWQRRQLFKQDAPAKIVIEQLLNCQDRGFYKLHEFSLMPDHLHILLTPGETVTIEKCMQMIKGGSAFTIRRTLNFQWPVWQEGFHDRWLRDAKEFNTRTRYIRENPVKANLATSPETYVWSSASQHFPLDPSMFTAS